MRVAMWLLVAACWRQEQTTKPREPEPDSTIVYEHRRAADPFRRAEAAPPVGPIFGGGRPLPLAPPCGSVPNAAAAGIKLSAINRTATTIDVCARMDRALSKARSLAAYRGFEVATELSSIRAISGVITCSVKVEIVAPPPRVGIAAGGATVQIAPQSSQRDVGLAIDDCVSAVIEDLFVRKIFP